MAKRETERDRLLKEMQSVGNQPKGFSGWFKNVFVYNYLKPTLIVIVVLAAVVFFVHDMATKTDPDITITIMSDKYFESDEKAVLSDFLRANVGDINGDGKLKYEIIDQAMLSGSGASTDAAQKMEAFEITFLADPSSVLYLIHEDYLNYFRVESSYFALSDYGIESDREYFLYANDFPVIQRLLADKEGDYYFAIKACELSKRDDKKYVKYYDAAIQTLQAIMTAE